MWSFSCEEVVGGSFGKSLGAAHANGTPAAVDVRSPVRDPVGDILPDPVGDILLDPVGDGETFAGSLPPWERDSCCRFGGRRRAGGHMAICGHPLSRVGEQPGGKYLRNSTEIRSKLSSKGNTAALSEPHSHWVLLDL